MNVRRVIITILFINKAYATYLMYEMYQIKNVFAKENIGDLARYYRIGRPVNDFLLK